MLVGCSGGMDVPSQDDLDDADIDKLVEDSSSHSYIQMVLGMLFALFFIVLFFIPVILYVFVSLELAVVFWMCFGLWVWFQTQ